MKLSDYMSAEKFPLTSQKGLSAKQQFRIDAHNYDALKEHPAQGNQLTDRQRQILRELEAKIPAQKQLKAV